MAPPHPLPFGAAHSSLALLPRSLDAQACVTDVQRTTLLAPRQPAQLQWFAQPSCGPAAGLASPAALQAQLGGSYLACCSLSCVQAIRHEFLASLEEQLGAAGIKHTLIEGAAAADGAGLRFLDLVPPNAGGCGRFGRSTHLRLSATAVARAVVAARFAPSHSAWIATNC
jgi:hypothetical protein